MLRNALLTTSLLAMLALACDGTVHDCACTISIGEASQMLGCGDTACIAGSRFGCDEDNVVSLGLCVPPDAGANGDGGACLALQASCDPVAASCCAGQSDDGGSAVAPSCDPISLRCCVATGSICAHSADCCDGRACVAGGGDLRCGS